MPLTERVEAPTYPVEQIELALIDDFEENPQEMTDEQFSHLVEEIAESGWTVPLQVIGPLPNGRYNMMGGHHRRKAADVLGYTHVPAMILPYETFTDDVREIQVVKQNILQGQLNAEKFTSLFNRLTEKYDADMLRSMMAFTKSDAFNKVYLDARKGLPPEMQEKLDETRQELKTVDDLSLVLNRLFTDYGSTVKFHAMFLTYGGREHIMIQLQAPAAYGRVKDFVKWCVDNKLMVDEELMQRVDWPVK